MRTKNSWLNKVRRKAFSWLAGDSVSDPIWFGSGGGGWNRYFDKSDREANNNTIVMACILWACRAFTEPPLVVKSQKADGTDEAVPAHLLSQLWKRPQKLLGEPTKLTGRRMAKGLIYSYMMDGNAYLHVVRSGVRPIGLDYIVHTNCRPVSVPGKPNILQKYNVYLNGAWQDVPPEDIIHFADGVDPENPLKGLSPLKSAMRQVMTDNEAAIYSHAILKMPVPSFMFSPADSNVTVNQQQADELAAIIASQTSGENRGKVIVPNMALTAHKMGLSPEEMALDKMLKVPEERISAIFGIPAIVAGLGAGLDRSTFANMKEAREAATESFLAPLWMSIADDLDDQLLPLLSTKTGEFCEFDLRKVRVLQDDQDALWRRADNAYKSGRLKRSEARGMTGFKSDAADEVYLTDIQSVASGDQKTGKAVRSAFERMKDLKALEQIND